MGRLHIGRGPVCEKYEGFPLWRLTDVNLLKNIWFQRCVGAVSILYTLLLGWMAYAAAFYRVEYVNKPLFAFVFVAVNLLMLTLMLLGRKTVLVRILSILNMIFYLPLVLLDFKDWLMIIPPAIVVLVMFFCSGNSESCKTVLGVILVLIYVLAALGYFVLSSLLLTKVDGTRIQDGVSKSGNLRYYVMEVKDNSGGRTDVYVEPNNLDKDFGMIVYRAKGYQQRKYTSRSHEVPTIEWRDGDELYINNERCEYKIGKRQFVLD